jgi:hypothetical protein
MTFTFSPNLSAAVSDKETKVISGEASFKHEMSVYLLVEEEMNTSTYEIRN